MQIHWDKKTETKPYTDILYYRRMGKLLWMVPIFTYRGKSLRWANVSVYQFNIMILKHTAIANWHTIAVVNTKSMQLSIGVEQSLVQKSNIAECIYCSYLLFCVTANILVKQLCVSWVSSGLKQNWCIIVTSNIKLYVKNVLFFFVHLIAYVLLSHITSLSDTFFLKSANYFSSLAIVLYSGLLFWTCGTNGGFLNISWACCFWALIRAILVSLFLTGFILL